MITAKNPVADVAGVENFCFPLQLLPALQVDCLKPGIQMQDAWVLHVF